MKTISIVISAYQAQDWLSDCLDSVFSQILPKGWQMQILVGIDGCPTTLYYAQRLRHANLTIIALKQNRGTYITFNTLMRLVNGELICRFDIDDVMQKDYLARQIKVLEAGVDMTMTWSIYTDVNLRATSYVLAHEVYHPKNGLNCRGSEGQFIIRRQVWQRLGGFRAWRCGADTDFFKRLCCAGFQHQIIEKYLYLRRTHAGSLTAHPDSNFQSPLRLKIQKLTNQYSELYLAGKQSLRVEAEYESHYEYL
ncbi:MAG: glycosyltransferase family 2 protein [Gammaproteobacteria bacterium]|nr:glycosyltransferase family 2 protein [Gammaproteobacteria bacterium]